MAWPPSYQIRKSKRAKYLQCQIRPGQGLEVVVPAHLRAVNIEAFLEAQKAWILQHLDDDTAAADAPVTLPKTLNLLALDQIWHVHYPMQATQRLRLTTHAQIKQLLFNGISSDLKRMQQKLKQWLIQQAEQHLLPQLAECAQQTGLQYQAAGVRAQRSVWGTCSAQAVIHLNYQLLFLPKALVRHILLHELCHLKHLDHSKQFWQLLSELDPHCQQHKKMIKQAHSYIPHGLMSARVQQDML